MYLNLFVQNDEVLGALTTDVDYKSHIKNARQNKF